MGRLIGGSGGPPAWPPGPPPPLIGQAGQLERRETIFAAPSSNQFRPQEPTAAAAAAAGAQTAGAAKLPPASSPTAAKRQLATNNMGAAGSSWAPNSGRKGRRAGPEARMGLGQTMGGILLILFGLQVFLRDLEGFRIHRLLAGAGSLTLAAAATTTGAPNLTNSNGATATLKSLPTTTTTTTSMNVAVVELKSNNNNNNSASLINNNNTSERQQLAVVCNERCNCLQVETCAGHEVAPPDGPRLEAELAAFLDTWAGAGSDEPEPEDAAAANANATEPPPPPPPAKASQQLGMTLFPTEPDGGHLHNMLRHQHMRHNNHQPLGPGRDAGSSGPQLYAQSLYSSQAPKLSYHAHTPYVRASAAPTGANQTQRVKRLLPLAELDMANGKLSWTSHKVNPNKNHTPTIEPVVDWQRETTFVHSVEEMLAKLDKDTEQYLSLSLRDNQLQFEIWSELYALLAGHLRRRLHRLDLSQNELVKLGITFTGYIEHHLAQTHGAWPQLPGPTQSEANNKQTQLATNNKLPSIIARPGSSNQKHYPNQLMGAGKLYTLVRERLNGKGQKPTTNNNNNNNNNQTSMLLLQPMLIKALDLSHNKLKWLINDQFRALKLVQSIRLDHNRIRYIHQHAFSGLESLRYLNLNFNRLQVIYIEQFQTNYNLQSLALRSNYLAYLRGGSFASLANLKRLELSHNRMTIVSNNAFVGLESLEWLNCSSNQFVHVPSASLHPLTSLRQLDLSDNLIAQLAPGTFFHLPMEELWLEQNEQLVSIDRGAFWDLPYLRRLHLSWNPMLMSINSQAFVGTQSLQQIDVDGCQSLEATGRQLLDNITNAATSRQLRHEQLAINRLASSSAANHSDNHRHSFGSTTNNLTAASFHSLLAGGSRPMTQTNKQHLQQPQQVTQTTAKYFYFLLALALLVAALKLVFKFTSTSHYLRPSALASRRRRVYEANNEDHDQAGKDFGAEFELAIASSSHQPLSSASMSSCPPSASQSSSPSSASPTNSPIASSASCNHHDQSSSYDTSVIEESSSRANSEDDHRDDNRDREDHDDDDGHHTVDAHDGQGRSAQPQELAPSAACHDELAGQRQREMESEEEISVISGQCGPSPVGGMSAFCCQLGCGGAQRIVAMDHQQDSEPGELASSGSEPPLPTSSQTPGHSAVDLIHSQLIAAGFDYGHANCAHFYQSLGPALQLADMTANFVNLNMDFY